MDGGLTVITDAWASQPDTALGRELAFLKPCFDRGVVNPADFSSCTSPWGQLSVGDVNGPGWGPFPAHTPQHGGDPVY